MKLLQLSGLVVLSLACASPGTRLEPDAATEPDGAPEADGGPRSHDAALGPDAPADARVGPDAHPTDGPAADGGGSSFAVVQAIFNLACVKCHDAALPLRSEGLSYPALSLTMGVARANLINKTVAEKCGGVLVKPGDPDHSYLIHKLTDNPPCDGKRMPGPGMLAQGPPLPDDQIAVIRAWIAAGALP
jgi:hypothetical protein